MGEAKGHFPEQTHRALLAQIQAMLPVGASVIFSGDGEFDRVASQAHLRAHGWHDVCRTASNTLVTCCDISFISVAEDPPRGEYLAVSPVVEDCRAVWPAELIGTVGRTRAPAVVAGHKFDGLG